ncbi:MAG: hypothetical protein HY320_04990 [Armatimonadetes bacterium]|nr:hypothetical protein [Armatimonadota bacterium]
MSTDDQRELHRRAIHEAGHAVAAHADERRIVRVSIDEGAKRKGCCEYHPLPWDTPVPEHGALPESRRTPDILDCLQAAAAIRMAGWCAEEMEAERNGGITLCPGEWKGDQDAVALIAHHATDPIAGDGGLERLWRFYDDCQARVWRLLEERWCAVEALVDKLMVHGSIHGKQAKQIIENALEENALEAGPRQADFPRPAIRVEEIADSIRHRASELRAWLDEVAAGVAATPLGYSWPDLQARACQAVELLRLLDVLHRAQDVPSE